MEPLLKKISKVNYNNLLEKVLDKKDFTANTKSLLLSMLYKVEVAYADYKMVKVLVKNKEEFLKDIIETIDKKCVIIKLVEPSSEIGEKMQNGRQEAFIENNVALVCFPTEKSLLAGITLLMESSFYIKSTYRIIDFVIKDFFKVAYGTNIQECLLNFDGWAWNNQFKEKEQFLYSIIYYNFINLSGIELIEEWRKAQNTQDYIEKFTKLIIQKYGEANTKRILVLLYRFFLKVLVTSDYKNEFQEILEEAKNLKQAIDYMNDKPRYMQDIYDKKKNINIRIREIEEMMLDKKILKIKYDEINKFLPLDKQIFSVRRFLIMIKQERENLYNEIKNYNLKLDPKKYIKEKELLEERYVKFSDIEKIKKSRVSLKTEIVQIQNRFLELKEFEIGKLASKKEIVTSIYILRYYKNMKLSEDIYIKDENLLKISLWNYERKLLLKACQNHVFVSLSENNLENVRILSQILDTRIIDLKDIEILLKIEKNKVTLDIYDGEILDTSLVLNGKIKQLTLKPNKKMKLLV